jgi:hypothetical protein
MEGPYVVYGSPGSGSVPVEAALTLIGAHYQVIGETILRDVACNPDVIRVNPLGQVPTCDRQASETDPGVDGVWLSVARASSMLRRTWCWPDTENAHGSPPDWWHVSACMIVGSIVGVQAVMSVVRSMVSSAAVT